jgi:hypothetical protein
MTTARDQAFDALLKKLAPDVIRSNLVRAGLFLAGWEFLKSEIEKKVREFYMVDLDPGPISAQRYATKVLALDSGPEKGKVFRASMQWLVDGGALTEIQVARIREMRQRRNEIAHELPKILVNAEHPGIDVALVRELRDIIAALGRFWGRIEIDTDEELAGRDIADADIISGLSLLMEHLVAAAELSAKDPPSPVPFESSTP